MTTKNLEPIDLRIGLIFGTVLLLVLALYLLNGSNHQPHIYDTDPRNDRYIKDEMTSSQLQIFDRVLCTEKKQNGKKLAESQILNITGAKDYDAVNAAYQRWLECKELNRNQDHVVYPQNCPKNNKKKK